MQSYENLGAAISATQPAWLLAYLTVLVAANLGAVFFVGQKQTQGWRPRWGAIAIVVSFLLAGELMEYMYQQLGYVRLLGLAHIVCWGPVYAWIFIRREELVKAAYFGKFVMFYLVMAGISLTIDVIDVARYLLGETGSMI